MSELIPLAALLGIDWADQSHEISLQPAARRASDRPAVERDQLPHTPDVSRHLKLALRGSW